MPDRPMSYYIASAMPEFRLRRAHEETRGGSNPLIGRRCRRYPFRVSDLPRDQHVGQSDLGSPHLGIFSSPVPDCGVAECCRTPTPFRLGPVRAPRPSVSPHGFGSFRMSNLGLCIAGPCRGYQLTHIQNRGACHIPQRQAQPAAAQPNTSGPSIQCRAQDKGPINDLR